jgi:hypothetical protein
MSKANVVPFPELKKLVEQLKGKFTIALDEVDPSRIAYLKSEGKSRNVAKMTAVKLHPSVTPYRFVLIVYSQNFNELDEARQTLHVLRELRRIEGFEESKLGKYPLQDFPDIVEKFGTLWEDREDISINDVVGKATTVGVST